MLCSASMVLSPAGRMESIELQILRHCHLKKLPWDPMEKMPASQNSFTSTKSGKSTKFVSLCMTHSSNRVIKCSSYPIRDQASKTQSRCRELPTPNSGSPPNMENRLNFGSVFYPCKTSTVTVKVNLTGTLTYTSLTLTLRKRGLAVSR